MATITWTVPAGPHTIEIDPADVEGMEEYEIREFVEEQIGELMIEKIFPTITGGMDALR